MILPTIILSPCNQLYNHRYQAFLFGALVHEMCDGVINPQEGLNPKNAKELNSDACRGELDRRLSIYF